MPLLGDEPITPQLISPDGVPPGEEIPAEYPAMTGAPGQGISGGRWTPDAVRFLLKAIYGILAATRGPHWAWVDVEGEPLIDPTTDVMNSLPVVKDLAPEHVQLITVIAGHGTMVGKRLAADKQMRQMLRQPQEQPAARHMTETDSPYGPNRLEGTP